MSALLDPEKVRITPHAATRAVEMGITPVDIAMSIALPDEVREPGSNSKYRGMGRSFYDYGEHTAVVEDGEKLTVVTFLWRTREGWEKSYRDDPYSDRKRRDNPFVPDDHAA